MSRIVCPKCSTSRPESATQSAWQECGECGHTWNVIAALLAQLDNRQAWIDEATGVLKRFASVAWSNAQAESGVIARWDVFSADRKLQRESYAIRVEDCLQARRLLK